MQKLIRFSVRISSGIALLSFGLMLLFGDFILGVIGEEYRGSVGLLAIIGAGQLINCFCGSTGTILQMTGHQKDHLGILILGLSSNVILSLILVQDYGTLGVALATSISMIIWNLAGAIIIYNRLGIKSFLNFRGILSN
jgi:O-antigen/teichoic acid export membrane protein